MDASHPGSAAESITNSAVMASAGGFLDAFTYVGHGHVFANAITGNVVLLGVALAFATVCFAFFAGATIGAVCTLHFHNHAAWIVTGWLALGTLPFLRPGARANAELDQAAGI
jgi:uncharacterized membrane protein YoaK (UPF0700 family)